MEVQNNLQRYLRDVLTDRELEAFLDHVENCPECYEELELYYAIRETLGSDEEKDKNDKSEREPLEESLKRHLEMSRANLRLRKARSLIEKILFIAAMLTICALVYFSLTRRKNAPQPAWETEGLSEELSEVVSERISENHSEDISETVSTDHLMPQEWNSEEGTHE